MNTDYSFLDDLERVDFCGEGLHYIPRIQYGREHPRQYMQCIFKDGITKAPVLVWIHGGSWSDENLMPDYRPEAILAELAEAGWFIACIEYRLSSHACFPAQLLDCQTAIEYIRAHKKELSIDPDRIAVWGESAGGHLACMVGSNPNRRKEAQVQAVVAWYAPSDLQESIEHLEKAGEEDFVFLLLGETEDRMEAARKASPIVYAEQSMPPILLMHGNKDELVSYEQSVKYYEKLKRAGNDVRLITVENQGHGFFKGKQYYDIIQDFLKEKLVDTEKVE